MEKLDLIKLVKDIVDINNRSEEEIDALIEILKSNVPHPEVMDLVYFKNLAPEEIVEKALAYKTINL